MHSIAHINYVSNPFDFVCISYIFIILFLLHLYALRLYNQVILQGEYINMDSEADAGSQEGQGEKKDDSPPWWKV